MIRKFTNRNKGFIFAPQPEDSKEIRVLPQYFVQLDSLRAIAVLIVIVAHWFDHKHFLNRYLPNGELGVTLFFVLSGFLITGILLKNKSNIGKGTSSLGKVFKIFYLRRSLRIFPIYYAVLLVALIFEYSDVIKGFWWHVFYLSNFRFFLINSFEGSSSHFWSLAVEEQFYLFWPTFIILTPTKLLTKFFIVGIVIAICFRFSFFDPPLSLGKLLVPGCLDSFCIGALLAFGKSNQLKWYLFLTNNITYALVLAVSVSLTFTLFVGYNTKLYISLYLTIISLLFALIILICTEGVSNPFFKLILENKFLIFLGKISYGIYLYHNFIPYIFGLTLPSVLSPYAMYFSQLIRFIILIIFSSLSWYIIEKPLLKLKNRFHN